MSTTYTLIFQNNSENNWTAAVYQQPPAVANFDVMSLAWFTQGVDPGASATFSWGIDYEFVWSKTGELKPGVRFSTSQHVPADPNGSNNQISLTYGQSNGAFDFTGQTAGDPLGSLVIVQDRTIPDKQAAVGVAMGGAATYVVQAQPNITATFTPTPSYWITFGDNFVQGQVMDISQSTNTAAIVYEAGVFSMTATLNNLNNWTVQPTSDVNQQFIAARKQNRRARWGSAAA